MFVKNIIFIVALAIGSEALKCNLCIGSNQSDCAKNVTSSMLVQTCNPKFSSRGRSREFDESTTENSVSTSSSVDLNATTSSSTTTNNDTKNGDRPPKNLDTYCVYFTSKGSKYMTSGVERGCGYIYHNVDLCKFLKKKRRDVDNCIACTDDQCN